MRCQPDGDRGIFNEVNARPFNAPSNEAQNLAGEGFPLASRQVGLAL